METKQLNRITYNDIEKLEKIALECVGEIRMKADGALNRNDYLNSRTGKEREAEHENILIMYRPRIKDAYYSLDCARASYTIFVNMVEHILFKSGLAYDTILMIISYAYDERHKYFKYMLKCRDEWGFTDKY